MSLSKSAIESTHPDPDSVSEAWQVMEVDYLRVYELEAPFG